MSVLPLVRALLVAAALSATGSAACGGASASGADLLPQLRSAMDAPVDGPEQRDDHSRLADEVVTTDVLQDMTRQEVEAAIGRGEPCSRHPKCGELEFSDDDWYYAVGRMGQGHVGVLPVVIVGFDRFGKVDRVWNMRTH